MTGQYNTLDLAGVSIANQALRNPFFTFLTELSQPLVPIIGHHLGQGKKEVSSDFLSISLFGFSLIYRTFWLGFLFSTNCVTIHGLEVAVSSVAIVAHGS